MAFGRSSSMEWENFCQSLGETSAISVENAFPCFKFYMFVSTAYYMPLKFRNSDCIKICIDFQCNSMAKYSYIVKKQTKIEIH